MLRFDGVVITKLRHRFGKRKLPGFLFSLQADFPSPYDSSSNRCTSELNSGFSKLKRLTLFLIATVFREPYMLKCIVLTNACDQYSNQEKSAVSEKIRHGTFYFCTCAPLPLQPRHHLQPVFSAREGCLCSCTVNREIRIRA